MEHSAMFPITVSLKTISFNLVLHVMLICSLERIWALWHCGINRIEGSHIHVHSSCAI